MAETIPIDRIATEGTQSRAELNGTVVDEYAEIYNAGTDLPPIDVYFDEEVYWLADGFHRLKAVQQLGLDSITANVRPGGKREAILHAVGANETHGLRRTNADRRHAVLLMLNDPEWRQWSDRDLASRCMVSHTFVNRIRHEMNQENGEPVKDETRTYQRSGKTQTMRTKNIGAAQRRSQPDPEQVIGIEEAQKTSTVNGLQLDGHVATADVQSAQEPETPLTEPDVSTAAAAHEPVVISDVPPDAPPVAVPQPDADAASLPAEDAEIYSVEEAWAWATGAEREAFVAQHRSELKKIMAKIERQAGRVS